MGLIYFFDDKIKPHIMKGKRYCNPANTGIFYEGISCIRENDVNLWFYTKGKITIAIDAGHLNFPNMEDRFKKIGINPAEIKHLFITHADVDHCGGIDVIGNNIFPNAKVYIGKKEEAYLKGQIHRMIKLGFKINNCVKLHEGYIKLNDMDVINVGDIEIQAIHVPGHTLGHMCYIVDNKVLFSGDCLAINDDGGYSFFDFFTQYPDMNKKSLLKLKKIVENSSVKYVCTGHSGIRTDMSKIFKHIDQSASFSKNKPFDPKAPWDIRNY